MATRFYTNKSTQGDENERNPGGNNTSEFSTDRVFTSRQDLMDWVQKVGHSIGFVIVTKRSKTFSGITSKVTLMCDRGGIYKNKGSNRHTKVTKKINCPFELVGKYSKIYDFWTLRVICEKHNHEPAPIHMKGHPYTMRLSDNETRLVLDLSRKNVKPEVILMILKKLNTNNMSNLRTIYNLRQKFRLAGETIDGEEMASPSLTECPLYTFNANKLKRARDHIDPFAIRNVLQEIDLSKYGYDLMVTNPVKDVSIANLVREVLMCNDPNGHDTNAPDADEPTSVGPFQPYRDVVLNKPQGQFWMKQFLDKDYAHDQYSRGKGGTEREREGVVECQTNTDVESTDKEDKVKYVEVEKKPDTGDENERKFAVNETFVGQLSNSEESASSRHPSDANKLKKTNIEESASPNLAYTFNANTSKRSIDQTYPIDISNFVQGVDSAKYEPVTEDIEEDFVFPRKQISMPSSFGTISPLHVDLTVTKKVNGHDTNAPHTDQVRPFQPYQDVVLNKPQGDFLMKQFLDVHYALNESLTGEGGRERECQPNTAVESADKEDKVKYAEVEKPDAGDENERKFAVHGISEFSTNRVFKSRQELMDWVQHVGRSLGYIIVTKRSKSKVRGVMSKVILMCDRGGMYKTKSSIRRTGGTRKTNCPFELVGKYSKVYGFWTLRVKCEKHNHEPAPPHMKGHPYAMRLSDNEERLVVNLLKKNVSPQEILSTLKKQNANNMTTIRTIYSARQKLRRTEHAETFVGQHSNSEDSASPSPVYTTYTSDANKSKRTNIEENASPSPAYAFDANKLKRSIDQTYPFDIRNLVQGVDAAEYEAVKEDIEEDFVFLRKQMPMLSSFGTFPPLQVDLMVTNNGNGHGTIAPNANEVRPFQPYRDAVLNKPQGEFLMKRFLEGDSTCSQSLSGKGGTESVVESQVNIVIDSTDKQDKDRNDEVVNEYCGRHQFKMETIDSKDYVDQYPEIP